ncbi:hypothetical protein RHMOL_Rhmol01G0234300 [Rhododendron molle]|uniref:Uncharacterized protein n=1 Tax=Rhododendron molle TaxID=49168 RepID=A0ACC0Q6H5_RHOML|nr:hypothetical protein RHMOL_Rhmol01G0234300 [Rhododendron molle]
MSSVVEKLIKSGHLKPLDPTPLPKNPSTNFKPNLYCAYHQSAGHLTDSCYHLRHAIQDLIDDNMLAMPPPPSQKPNIISNSFPKHNTIPHLSQISLNSTHINLSSTIFNPTDHIILVNQPKPIVSMPL